MLGNGKPKPLDAIPVNIQSPFQPIVAIAASTNAKPFVLRDAGSGRTGSAFQEIFVHDITRAIDGCAAFIRAYAVRRCGLCPRGVVWFRVEISSNSG